MHYAMLATDTLISQECIS